MRASSSGSPSGHSDAIVSRETSSGRRPRGGRGELPEIDGEDFRRGLEAVAPALSEAATETLLCHYRELRRWNRSLSLVGPGTVSSGSLVLSRHYGEALAALALIPPEARVLVDVGSGGGFPGFVLAAARPDLAVTLVEPRQRKAAFLRAASRAAALPCQILDARVASPLPSEFPRHIDILTLRALKLSEAEYSALARRLGPEGRMLLWAGGEEPSLPRGLVVERRIALAGSERRKILVVGQEG